MIGVSLRPKSVSRFLCRARAFLALFVKRTRDCACSGANSLHLDVQRFYCVYSGRYYLMVSSVYRFIYDFAMPEQPLAAENEDDESSDCNHHRSFAATPRTLKLTR